MRTPLAALAITVPLVVAGAVAGAGAASGAPRVGEFTADLSPVNSPGSGSVTLVQRGSNLTVSLSATGLDDGIHVSHIHGFGRSGDATCPDASADANGDGFVDIVEGLPSYGPVVRTLGMGQDTGSEIDFTRMFRHTDAGDGIASMGGLDRYVVVVHGVDLDGDGVANNPDVEGDGPDPDDNEIAMPALCGEIVI